MTKRERVMATLERRPVDRPPVAFWRHVPDRDHDPRTLASAMLEFHRRFDLDLIKLMPSNLYCVEDWGGEATYTGEPNGAKRCTRYAVQRRADWARLTPLDPGTGALGRELEALRLTVAGRHDDAPVLHTIFSPWTIARKLAGERLEKDLAEAPEAVETAVGVIAQTVARYAAAALTAGADGIFLATQVANAETALQGGWSETGEPFLASLVESLRPACPLILLHCHGRKIYYDTLATLPVHALNWHDRITKPSLAEGKRRFAGAVVGGLSEWHTLLSGPAAQIAAEVRDAAAQTEATGLIVAPGCVLPLDVPDEHLDAVVRTVTSGGMG